MNTDNKISRRDFIKSSVITGGALLASSAIPGQVEKPRDFDPFGQTGLSPLATI